MSNRANRVKAILRDLELRLGSEEQNEEKLKKFLDTNGYKGPKRIDSIVNWYEDLKTKYKKMILRHFKVERTEGADLDSKLNKLLRDQHLEVQNPSLGWLVKWVERTNTEEEANKRLKDLERQQREQSLDDEWNNFMSMTTPDIR